MLGGVCVVPAAGLRLCSVAVVATFTKSASMFWIVRIDVCCFELSSRLWPVICDCREGSVAECADGVAGEDLVAEVPVACGVVSALGCGAACAVGGTGAGGAACGAGLDKGGAAWGGAWLAHRRGLSCLGRA